MTSEHLTLSEEVADALAAGRPVVALESTLLAHGLPPGRNLEVGRRLERVVRDGGAVPATVAVLDGRALVGLTPDQLERVCDAGLAKLSLRDLGPAVGLGGSGATTVASTAALADAAGVRVFATGGLGGVHHPLPGETVTWDVSADLGVLAKVATLVVCSGVKSILDIPATLEVLETNSVAVLGYRTDDFPAFYRRSSGLPVSRRVDDPKQAAAAYAAHRALAGSGALLANPVPEAHELDAELHDRLLAEGLELLRTRGVQGSDVTPVLLEHFHTASGGVSLDANEELVVANAALGTEVAASLSELAR
ncbi:pseudouridine-5'-phosphate glycosidase [Amycolatopsis suaedae]|uniref:Pseudouridine-5'-phosphate glycosidase n=1 Tax=Amycolatopsis suaedae TaxID=2510978 RepID=A0A4Q7JA87_9PSEU|nr:pseudouridine-5'-phosphate glycosidase [Amycolatopsis suaedae]RZQ63094.1 pseudouridine-5'-phosphate glycosidase [Amycolatopsis suaedae]